MHTGRPGWLETVCVLRRVRQWSPAWGHQLQLLELLTVALELRLPSGMGGQPSS